MSVLLNTSLRLRPIALACSLGLLLAACGDNELILEGERLPVRPDEQGAANQLADVPALSMGNAVSNADWTHLNGDTTHRADHVAVSHPLAQIWSAGIGRGTTREGRITSGPIVVGGTIYVMDTTATVSAFGTNGALLWQRDLAPGREGRLDGFGGGVSFGGGTLVAGTGFGEVVALEPDTGAIRWRQEIDAPVRAAPTVSNGLAYVVARNDQAFGIDLKNGRIRWRAAGIEPEAGIVGGASPAARAGLVVVPYASGEVVGVVARNGRRAWSAALAGGRRGHVRGRISDITGDPVIDGNVVYVANQSGRFAALDRRSGQRIWSVNEGSNSPALPVGDSVFLMTDTGKLQRLRASDGSLYWSVQLPEFSDAKKRRGAHLHSGPVLAGGRVIVASSDGVMRSFDPSTGAALGETAIGGGGAAAQPAVAGGRVYVISRNGTLFAFQ